MRKWGFAIPLGLPALFALSVWQGGAWTWLVVLVVFGFIPVLDLLLGRDRWNPDEALAAELESSLFYRAILYAWVPLQFATLAGTLLYVDRAETSAIEFSGLMISLGVLTGGIGITVAHELGHKLSAVERWLARLLLVSVCYMHFHVEHNRGHHARVATPLDPASARKGQSLFAFLPQTLIGSFASAWRFERERLAKLELPAWHWRNQVLLGLAGSAAMVAVAWKLAGGTGLALFFGQSAVAILLLEVVNYVEHYGLERKPRADGGYERVDVTHSWNASERFTNWFLFNLQRHSHHHVAHHRRYQALRHFDESPQLPTGYAGMVLLALVPPLWRRVMDERLRRWQQGAAT